MNGIEKTQGQVQHVGKLCIYVSPDGKLITGMGNCRVVVGQSEAKAILDQLFILASQFAGHVVAQEHSNGHARV